MSFDKTLSDFKVGLLSFCALSLVVTGIVFAGGDSGLLFSKKSVVHAHLSDVGGLKVGAPVTMGGLSIGKVSEIKFTDIGGLPVVSVAMDVTIAQRQWIKSDSVPSIRTQGMMGDRYIDIAIGSPDSPALAEGTPLKGSPVTEIDKTLEQATNVLNETRKLLEAVNMQQGTVGQLFYDPEFYVSLTNTVQELNSLLKDFQEHPKKYINLEIF